MANLRQAKVLRSSAPSIEGKISEINRVIKMSITRANGLGSRFGSLKRHCGRSQRLPPRQTLILLIYSLFVFSVATLTTAAEPYIYPTNKHTTYAPPLNLWRRTAGISYVDPRAISMLRALRRLRGG